MARLREQGIVAVAFGALGLALGYAWGTPAETPEPVAAQAPSAELAERRRCVTEQELASALDAQRIALLAGVRAELDAMQPLAPATPPTLATASDASDAAPAPVDDERMRAANGALAATLADAQRTGRWTEADRVRFGEMYQLASPQEREDRLAALLTMLHTGELRAEGDGPPMR